MKNYPKISRNCNELKKIKYLYSIIVEILGLSKNAFIKTSFILVSSSLSDYIHGELD